MATTKPLERTLMLSPYFGPGHFGGIELCAQLAWDAISTANPASTLFTTGRPLGSQPWVGVSATSKRDAVLTALRHQWKADQVLVWHLGLLKLLPFLRLPRRTNVTLFLHGIEVWRPLTQLMRHLLSRVDRFLSNSEHTWQRLLEFQPQLRERPHRTVPLGVGVPLPGLPPPPANRPAALIIGRMVRAEDYKGHREVIAAWAAVRNALPDAELWIIGDGDLRADLELTVAALDMKQGVHFMGRLPDAERDVALAQSHALLMPSRGEGFGLVYLEAMRYGRPCLVSTLDAGREVVNPPEAGLAVNPDDREALVSAICRLITPGTEWERWSRQSQQRYDSRFTAAHYQQRLLAALSPQGLAQ